MPLHLIKLCVGCDSIEDLAAWQTERLKEGSHRPAVRGEGAVLPREERTPPLARQVWRDPGMAGSNPAGGG